LLNIAQVRARAEGRDRDALTTGGSVGHKPDLGKQAGAVRLGLLTVAALLLASATVTAQFAPPEKASPVVLTRENERAGRAPVLELIRQKLPVGVHPGRFIVPDGESTFCIFSRNHMAEPASLPSVDGDLLPVCSMIPVYLDDVRVPDPATLLTTTQVADLESLELIRDEQAQTRYGIFDEVLVLWSKGCGPHVRRAVAESGAGAGVRASCGRRDGSFDGSFLPGRWTGDPGKQTGYLFNAPRVTISLRGGASVPNARDELHRMFTEQLTLSRRDFVSITYGGDVAVQVSPRMDLVLALSYGSVTRASTYRDWVDANDVPIEQTTHLWQLPVTIGARWYARERGRAAGKYAWVPVSFLPYAGIAGGMIWYQLEQDGWFVDFLDLDIFEDSFRASGNSAVGSVFGGTEWWPSGRFGMTLEGRYTYARAVLRPDFIDFRNINLSGFQALAGLSVRF
jgi:hypothetical protein